MRTCKKCGLFHDKKEKCSVPEWYLKWWSKFPPGSERLSITNFLKKFYSKNITVSTTVEVPTIEMKIELVETASVITKSKVKKEPIPPEWKKMSVAVRKSYLRQIAEGS